MPDYPTIEFVPGDDFRYQLTLTDANGDAVDYSSFTVDEAAITWSDGSTTDLTVDDTDADTGVFVLSCTDTATTGKKIGRLHSLKFKVTSPSTLKTTVYFAELEGVETLSSTSGTARVAGTQGPAGTNVIGLTQAEYDALTPANGILYVITD